jgi:hypothetical protein
MLHRVRVAMELGSFDKLSGEVEADESFVGGVGKHMHKAVKRQKLHERHARLPVPLPRGLEGGGLLPHVGGRPYPCLMAEAAKPDRTPFERFEEATRRLLSTPKREVQKAELRAKKERQAREAEGKKP